MHAERPSSTALLIARCILLADRDPALRPLVPPGAVEPLMAMLASVGGGQWFQFALKHESARASLRTLERAVLPGIVAHYLARKQWIEQRALEALDAGCTQFVVLGAGFDTLAWRLHQTRPDVNFMELDHAATQRPKSRALVRGRNVTFVPVDLTRTLPAEALRGHPHFDARRRTFWIAEGLFMYFAPARVKEILWDVAHLSGSEIAFTFMAPGRDGRATFRGGSAVIDAWLRLRHESFAWSIAPDSLAEFIRPLGLRLGMTAGAPELRSQVLAPAGLSTHALAEGEFLCTAKSCL